MSYTKKVKILIIFLFITMLIMFTTNSFSRWWANGAENAYDGEDEDSNKSTSTAQIGQYIVDGAGYFLDSYSYMLQFMRKVELADSRELNYPELSQLLDSALMNMQQARDTYRLLKETADITPYNPGVIEALKNFNYDLYCEINRLNKEIFTGVKSYLINGRVNETYGKLLADMGTMIDLLQTVKKNIDNNLFPPVGTVRQLNQTYSFSLLFGQYVADIFEAL